MLGQYTQDSVPSLASLSAPAPAQPQLEFTNCDLTTTGTGELSLSGGLSQVQQPGVMGFGGLTNLPSHDMTSYLESLTAGTGEELAFMQNPMMTGHGGLEVRDADAKEIYNWLRGTGPLPNGVAPSGR